MSYFIVGLGNPGAEYENTRHNVGRIVLEYVRKRRKFEEFEESSKVKALVSEGKIGKENVMLLMPEMMMNKSGLSVKPLVTSVKKAEKLIVVYDDLDLPLGRFKISFDRGTGGHRGLESITRHVKTNAYMRVRVGISPARRGGGVKKPGTEKQVIDYILGDFRKKERDVIDHLARDINKALEVLVTDGKDRAMNIYN
jgi:peptidyl-tRNA hydrolase, PTH1 family